MDVRGKLVELLQDGDNPVWGWFPNNSTMIQLAAYLIDHGVTVQEWISVNDRVPENDDIVMVIASGKVGNITLVNAFELATFSLDEGWILEMWPEWEDPKVTYWMPLPEPPKGE